MAIRHVLGELAGATAAAGLGSVTLEAAGGVEAAERVAEGGTTYDLVFLSDSALGRLAEGGFLDTTTIAPLMISQTAVAVRDPSVEQSACSGGVAYSDDRGVRDALRAARRVGYSTGPSGAALMGLIQRWGIAEMLADRLVQAPPGIPVAALLASGDVDLGFQQLSELIGQPGIRILGVMPPRCAIDTVFGGAVTSISAERHRAGRILAFFASAAPTPIMLRHTFTPFMRSQQDVILSSTSNR